MSDQTQAAALAAQPGAQPLAQPLPVGTQVEGWTVKAVLGQTADGFNYHVQSEKDGRERVLCEFFPAHLALRLGTVVVPTLRARHEFALALQQFVEAAQRERQAAHPAYPILSDVLRTNGSVYVVSLWHDGQPLRVSLQPTEALQEASASRVAMAAAMPSLEAPLTPTPPPWRHAQDDGEFMQALTVCVQSVTQAVPAGRQAEWPNRAPAKPSLSRPRAATVAVRPRPRPMVALPPGRPQRATAAQAAPERNPGMPLGLAAAAVLALFAGVWMTMQVLPDTAPMAARGAKQPAAATHMAPRVAPPVVVAFAPSAPVAAGTTIATVPAVAPSALPPKTMASANLNTLPSPAAGRWQPAVPTKAMPPAPPARAEMLAQAAIPADRNCSDWLVRQSLGMPQSGGAEAQNAAGCR
jgi:hypothetical protein